MHIKDVYPAKAWQAVFIDAANVLTFVIALALIVKTPKDTHDEWATRFLEGDNASIDYKAKAEWYSCGGLAGLEM